MPGGHASQLGIASPVNNYFRHVLEVTARTLQRE
jgi:hypothetical protein